jgi:putative sugar O-methyltransferase
MSVEVSNLWKSLCAELFTDIDETFLDRFRRPGGANSRLAAWDPFDRTMRYFRSMLYTAAERQPKRFFALYRALGRTDIGQPTTVKLRSCAIDIDYFLSVGEFLFLESAIDLQSVRSIVEIGAGFGRTCHTLMALSDEEQIDSYVIVDLPEVLELSCRALAKLVPRQYQKLRFIDATKEKEWSGLRADLAINIDSFQEMPAMTIDKYMRNIIAKCRLFYLKNPIAKYDPKAIDAAIDQTNVQDVFSLGYCRDIVDIFNDAALGNARLKYVDAYRPGCNWQLVATRPMEIFPYYQHAVYRNNSEL